MQSTSAAAVPFVSMETTVERIQTIRDIKHGLVASLKVAVLAISSTERLLLHEQTPIVAGH